MALNMMRASTKIARTGAALSTQSGRSFNHGIHAQAVAGGRCHDRRSPSWPTAFAAAGVTASPTLGQAQGRAAASRLLRHRRSRRRSTTRTTTTGVTGSLQCLCSTPRAPTISSFRPRRVGTSRPCFAPGSDLLNLSSVTVTIYGDSSGAPGAQVYTVTVPSGSFTDDLGFFGFPGGNLTIPIDATLTPGHYWLSVQGDGSYWYWEIRGVVSNHPAMWQNPDDGFVEFSRVARAGGIWRPVSGPWASPIRRIRST